MSEHRTPLNQQDFRDRNFWHMKPFHETYQADPKLSAALRELHPAIGNTFKDNDTLEFLEPPAHSENNLQPSSMNCWRMNSMHRMEIWETHHECA